MNRYSGVTFYHHYFAVKKNSIEIFNKSPSEFHRINTELHLQNDIFFFGAKKRSQLNPLELPARKSLKQILHFTIIWKTGKRWASYLIKIFSAYIFPS